MYVFQKFHFVGQHWITVNFRIKKADLFYTLFCDTKSLKQINQKLLLGNFKRAIIMSCSLNVLVKHKS